jgi:hypothetical protein
MKSLVLMSLFGVGALAIWKHHVAASHAGKVASDNQLPSGVSVYNSQPAPQQTQQILAAQATNPDAVAEPGFSGAFGPFENQPGDDEDLY